MTASTFLAAIWYHLSQQYSIAAESRLHSSTWYWQGSQSFSDDGCC